MFAKTGVGLEIVGRDLRVATVRSSGKTFRLTGTLELPGFLDLSPEEQKAALSALVQKHKLPAHRVYLSLARDRGTVRQLELPVGVGDKLQSAIALQIEALSPWAPEEIYWDFSPEPVRRDSKTVRVTVAIVTREALDPWIALFKDAGLPLSGACLSTVVQAHAIGVLWPGDSQTVVLDCQEGRVEGSLLQGGQLSSLTQTGENVTSTARLAVERLMAVGRVPSLVNARLLVFGSAASGLESREHVALPMENAALDSSDRFGSIAAAMLGLRKTAFQCNVVPKELRHQRNHAQWIPTYALLALALLLGVTMAARQPYQLTVYASKIDAEIQKVAPVANEVVSQQSELNKLSEKYRVLSGHFKNRDYALEAMRDITRLLPSGAWISSYVYQDGTITISGVAPTATEIQKMMEDSPVFKDAQFTTAVTRDAKGTRDRFSLKATVEVQQ